MLESLMLSTNTSEIMISGIKISEQTMTAIISGGVALLVAVIGIIGQFFISRWQYKKNQPAEIRAGQADQRAEKAEKRARKSEERAESAEERAKAAELRAQEKLEHEARSKFANFYAEYSDIAKKVFRMNDRFGLNLSKTLLSSRSGNLPNNQHFIDDGSGYWTDSFEWLKQFEAKRDEGKILFVNEQTKDYIEDYIDNVFNTADFLRDKVPQGFLGMRFFSDPTNEDCKQVTEVCEQYYSISSQPVSSNGKAKSEFDDALKALRY